MKFRLQLGAFRRFQFQHALKMGSIFSALKFLLSMQVSAQKGHWANITDDVIAGGLNGAQFYVSITCFGLSQIC
jgi:hypothetical protein